MNPCSCIICHKEYSNKGIHSHYNINHTIEGKEKHKTTSKISSTIGANKTQEKYNLIKEQYILNPNKCQQCSVNLSYKQRNNKFCSNTCSAQHINKNRVENGYYITNEHKLKTSNTLKNKPKILKTNIQFLTCKFCHKLYIYTKMNKDVSLSFCSKNCFHIHRSNIAKNTASKTIKRSKQEIELYNLCKNHFTNVTNNTQFFNGWDADILIHDINLAILWNGPWHYQEMKGLQHSLKQVQNRDNIKINEIQKLGWNYIIFEDRYYTPETAFKSIIKYT
ncbi:MAG: hypothetical protein WC679_00505 [Bacteroidales bacterium]|jgi:hypothetical protein